MSPLDFFSSERRAHRRYKASFRIGVNCSVIVSKYVEINERHVKFRKNPIEKRLLRTCHEVWNIHLFAADHVVKFDACGCDIAKTDMSNMPPDQVINQEKHALAVGKGIGGKVLAC